LIREMIFFFAAWPRAFAAYQAIFTCVSFASDPELAKNTLPAGNGEISFSFSASAIAGSWLRPPKMCANAILRICSAATSASSSTPQPSAVHHNPAIASM
jgi:hypothetical protein